MSVEFYDGSDIDPSNLNAPREVTTEDEDYYMEPFFLTFEVDGRLFRVPSYQFFKESPEFSEIYQLSAHVRANDGNPIMVEKVSQVAFRSLLKVLYPLPMSVKMDLLKEEWISVITLASGWKFLRVREMARLELECLGSLTSLEKVCLGRDLSIPSWVISGFIGLIQAVTITDDEALKIDSAIMTTAYKLFRIRELRIDGRLTSTSTKVEEIFQEELNRLRTEEKMFNDEKNEEKIEYYDKEEVKVNNKEMTGEKKEDISWGKPAIEARIDWDSEAADLQPMSPRPPSGKKKISSKRY